MTESGFYHLTRSGPLEALPKLLGRTLAAGTRAVVLCPDKAAVSAVGEALWASTSPDWLPHGSGDMQPEWQPIWLAANMPGPAPNGARFLFLIGGVAPMPGYDRIFDLFDGNSEEEVRQARLRWARARQAGDRLTYWQQGDRTWVAKTDR